MSPKLSAWKSCSATYWGPVQRAGHFPSRRRVVSGGGSASAGSSRAPTKPAAPETVRTLMNSRRLQRSRTQPVMGRSLLPLQLLLELVDEAPVRALSEDLLWARLHHFRFVEPQRVEAHGIRGLVLGPSAERHVAHRLQSIVIRARESPVDDAAGRTIRSAHADLVGLQDRPESPLGCHRVAVDELAIAEGHAAEILRPRAILRGVDHDVADSFCSQLLRLGRKAEVGVHLAAGEELHRLPSRRFHPTNVLRRS